MQRFLVILSVLLLFVVVGEIVYLFVLPNVFSLPNKNVSKQQSVGGFPNIDTELQKRIKFLDRRHLYNYLGLVTIALRPTTKSSVLVSVYEGMITKVVQTPELKPPFPQLRVSINSGKDEVMGAYTSEELKSVSVVMKEGDKMTEASLIDLREGVRVRLDENFDIKTNRLVKSVFTIQK